MTIRFEDEELSEVTELLEMAFRDLRVEVRHTHVSGEREHFKHREKVLLGVLEKLGSPITRPS